MLSGPIVQGSLMGLAIYAADMILRPRLAGGTGMEILLFLVEGLACDLVYGALKKTNDFTKDFGGNVSLQKSAIAGLTIWISDFFLRPGNVNGLGPEFVKFLLQGFLVMMVFNYTPATDNTTQPSQ